MLTFAPPSGAAGAVPTVRGPIEGGIWGHALFDSPWDLREVGYVEAEYFVTGTARAHGAKTTAPYTTRIIVARPKDAKRFNGTVLLDWTNVTAQFENAVDSLEAREVLLRVGFAWVHVSAQSAGVCCSPLTPMVWDPVRYADLNHPGDDYAYDIFTQIGRSIRKRKGPDPMGGLKVRTVLAAGQSQSASRLSTYVREVAGIGDVVDGILIHGGGSKRFAKPPSVPVLHLLSDLEADPEKPNTSTNYRLWEVAGTAHSDFWIGYAQVFGQGPRTVLHADKRPYADARQLDLIAGNYGGELHPMQATCIVAGGQFPMRYAVGAGLLHLERWARGGAAPRNGPRFTFDDSGMLARDANRNALGGIRLPPIVHPVATYESTACGLGGITRVFTPPELGALYDSHADYFAKMRAATKRSVAEGYMLPADATDMLQRACSAKVPSPVLTSTRCTRKPS
ncbi:MAG: alpha/beta hydrolase domain-containing protein [Actinomycetota bacterium]